MDEVFRTFKWELDGYEVVKLAIELMRLELGNYMVDGKPIEASPSKCIELICADYIAGREAEINKEEI